VRLKLETMDAKSCMICLWKKWTIFYFTKGLVIVNCKHLQSNMVLFENCKDIAIDSLFKRKNETKEEILKKKI